FDPRLLELVPDPLQPGYRFSAEVRHEGNSQGSAGICFGLMTQDTDRGRLHWAWVLTFADRGRPPAIRRDAQGRPLGLVYLALYQFSGAGAALSWKSSSTRTEHLFPLEAKGAKRWRPLAVEVTPAEVRVFWGEGLIGTRTHAELNTCLRNVCVDRNGIPEVPPPAFHPRGGLGLYLYNGAASF